MSIILIILGVLMNTHILDWTHPQTDDDIIIEIHYDAEPYEPPTMDCPGSPGGIIIYKIFDKATDKEISNLFNKTQIIELEERIADDINSNDDGPDEPDFDPYESDREADRAENARWAAYDRLP